MSLPNLASLCSELSHVVLLYNAGEKGTCFLGLGAKLILEIGGQTSNIKAFEALEEFSKREEGKYTFGALSYDLKNSIHNLKTSKPNTLGLPDLCWWQPEVVIKWHPSNKEFAPEILQGDSESELAIKGLDAIKNPGNNEGCKVRSELVWAWKKDTYIKKFKDVKNLIQAGDVYELNLCQNLRGKAPSTSSWSIFTQLYSKTRAPFSAYLQAGKTRIMSGSPERFLKREGGKLISEPIKGTTARGSNEAEDLKLIEELRGSEKERAENIMIADLVRNDLSRVARRGTVEVEDLCGIHTFETVHQMITRITCEVDDRVGISDILKATYPMGSMTGAPKLSAMENIDLLEEKGRGIYSGSVGYISPDGDFDLNVLIRSLFHNADTEKIEATVGGAITSLSKAEDEYKECKLKAEALIKTIQGE